MFFWVFWTYGDVIDFCGVLDMKNNVASTMFFLYCCSSGCIFIIIIFVIVFQSISKKCILSNCISKNVFRLSGMELQWLYFYILWKLSSIGKMSTTLITNYFYGLLMLNFNFVYIFILLLFSYAFSCYWFFQFLLITHIFNMCEYNIVICFCCRKE